MELKRVEIQLQKETYDLLKRGSDLEHKTISAKLRELIVNYVNKIKKEKQ